ncbi:LOW QUALITY PROTEIN: 39S ribosomal protein L1, mitochondrial-like [Uloborus diversus]|uniref:LOW QUALITY PROTEIN: 39S ribosomal protein L1, mitochondrial-like n=1 Tax=Uloborus diversus TaxID=327109 RepID=UPI002409C98B|nr:LOW QUALITY PROTEIN: 39S ribosomal protein L1, mitochondrial-like [Uloborus diversus]
MFVKGAFSIISNYTAIVRKTVFRPNLFPSNFENCLIPSVEQVRYAARKGTRAAKLAAKKARKLQDANKPAPIPKYLQRKVKVNAALEKKRCTDENWLETQPVDDVYNMKLYRGKPYSVAEAIEIHRGTHIPSILNDPSAMVYASIELELKLKKKDRFMDEFSGIITFPHEFVTGKQNRIIVICKESEDQVKATDAGALYAGSTTLIKQILSGSIASDDYDYLICHPDMFKEVHALRGMLKRKFPSANNGLLRLDLEKGVKNFMHGVEYNLTRSAVEPDFGWVDVCFGRLDMPIEKLEENLKFALNTIEKHKPVGTAHLLFILRTLLFCEKSRDRLKIPHWKYLSHYPENGILLEVDSDDEELGVN